MDENILVLWEYQKTRVCKFYGCRDSNGKRYPDCNKNPPIPCELEKVRVLLGFLSEKRKKKERRQP